MNIVALVTFSSAAGLPFAVRLTGCAGGIPGAAAARLPVIFTGAAALTSCAAARCRIGVMT
jgi:hypothetical protein